MEQACHICVEEEGREGEGGGGRPWEMPYYQAPVREGEWYIAAAGGDRVAGPSVCVCVVVNG